MRKVLSILFLLVAFTLMFSVVSFAADGDLVKEWTGAELKGCPGNAIKNDDNTRGFYHDEVIDGDHPVWGCEVEQLDGNGKLYTMVIKLKVVADDGTDDDTVVFYFDPKMRTYQGGAKVDGPADQPKPVTAKEIHDAKEDSDGIKTFYYTFGPDQYGNNEKIAVECRIQYKGSTKGTDNYFSFDLVSIALYEGEVTDLGSGGSGGTGGDETKVPETSDPSLAIATLMAAAAAFGALKLKRK